MGAIWLLRRASLRLSIQAGGIVPVIAIVAGTLGTARAMFLSQHDLGVMCMVCVVAGVVAAAVSWLLGRRVRGGEHGVAAGRAVDRRRDRRVPGARPAAGGEFAALSGELADTSASWPVPRAGARPGAVPARTGGLGLA